MIDSESREYIEKIRALANRAFDGVFTSDDRARLHDLLLCESESRRELGRREFLACSRIHAMLACKGSLLEADARTMGLPLPLSLAGQQSSPQSSPREKAPAEDKNRSPSKNNGRGEMVSPAPRGEMSRRLFRRPRALSIAAGICALLVMLMVMSYLRAPQHRPQPSIANDNQPEEMKPYAALLASASDCRWTNAAGEELPSDGWNRSRWLRSGETLYLLEGFAEIQFRGGAKVVLQGPARFTPDDDRSGRLDRGSLAARVPRKAAGFFIATPRFKVIDIGTEFGLRVADDEAGEVHVFSGAVDVCLESNGERAAAANAPSAAPANPSNDAPANGRRLTTGQTVRLAPQGGGFEPQADETPEGTIGKSPSAHSSFGPLRLMLGRVGSAPSAAPADEIRFEVFAISRDMGDEAVLAGGQYEKAWNVGNGGELTVNGVKFLAANHAAAPPGVMLAWGPAPPERVETARPDSFDRLEWAEGDFKELMRTFAVSSVSDSEREKTKFDVTLDNLTVGAKYRVQFFMAQPLVPSTPFEARTMRKMRVQSGEWQSAPFNAVGDDGRYSVVAHFVADAATRTFSFAYAADEASGRSILNGVAVFSLPPREGNQLEVKGDETTSSDEGERPAQ